MAKGSGIGDTTRALAVLGVASAAAFAWGSLVERNLFTLRRVTAPVLEPGSEPIRVLHLSDLHMAPWQQRKQQWLRSLTELRPDLIVNTGDNLGHMDGLRGVENALDVFSDVPGVYVLGSNDYFAPTPKNPLRYFLGPSKSHSTPRHLDTDALTQYFDSLGWMNLTNTADQLIIKGTRMEFFGVDDPHRRYDRLDKLAGAIDTLREDDVTDSTWPDDEPLENLPMVTVGVSHAPYQRVLNSFVTHGAQMIFAGHTHGGQVCVPGFGALVTNCDIPRGQVKGLTTWSHALRTAYLNVSAGLGTSIYAPVRFACRPEATLLTLTPRLR